jgi:hypothetical protein
MKYMLILAVLAMLWLTACGGNAEPTATSPTPQTDSVPQATVGNTSSPTEASSPGELSFSIVMTGDTSLGMTQSDPDTYAAVQINADGDINFRFASNNSSRLIDITFKNIDAPTSGTYIITDWAHLETTESGVFVSINDFTDPENLLTLFAASGTLTLNVGDGVYNGTFQFEVSGDYGSTRIGQATMVGTFSIPD